MTPIKEQQQKLIKQHPELLPYFIDIKVDNTIIPFLPIRCMRRFFLFTGDKPERIFQSSGSTQNVRARHAFSKEALQRYEVAASAGFRSTVKRFGFENATVISLVPRSTLWPNSSLAFMIEAFSRQNINVIWELNEWDQNKQSILFGTSFHHYHFLKQQPILPNTLLVIDTGGTKGQTHILGERELFEAYQKRVENLSFISEYGMCELASQAYSKIQPHNRTFITNPELRVFALNKDFSGLTRNEGYLAFIDSNNSDSYPALITEDLGFVHDDHEFVLSGRAPDASDKGCSLNVRSTYSDHELEPQSPYEQSLLPELRQEGSSLWVMVSRTPFEPELWSEDECFQLQKCLNGLFFGPKELPLTRLNQHALIVCSANIPITWIYPAVTLAMRGVCNIEVRLPSLRPLDTASQRVRNQIDDLVLRFQSVFFPVKVHVNSDARAPLAAFSKNVILVFGSDETIEVFRKNYQGSACEVIGCGDFVNGMTCNSLTEALPYITAWHGRGCLTPRYLNCPDFISEKEIRSFLNAWNHLARDSHSPLSTHTKHEILSVFPAERIHLAQHVLCVDIRQFGLSELLRQCLEDARGPGVVILTDQTIECAPIMPNFADKHISKTWSEWIN